MTTQHNLARPNGENAAAPTAAGPSFVLDPMVSASGRFPLTRPVGYSVAEEPSADGARPWNLRRMGPVTRPAGRPGTGSRYDPVRQISVGPGGDPLTGGPPTANTTTKTDGQDPPSAEDWNNDFHGDEMP